MPKISQHSSDIAVVAVRRDHTSGVSVLKVYRPWDPLHSSFTISTCNQMDKLLIIFSYIGIKWTNHI